MPKRRFQKIWSIAKSTDQPKKSKFQNFVNELRSIKSIDLTYGGSNIIEKIWWSSMGIIGTIWAFYFVSFLILDWGKNPTFKQKGNFYLSNLKYPAMTLCSETSTKYAIVEQMGNYMDPENLPKEAISLLRKYKSCANKNISSEDPKILKLGSFFVKMLNWANTKCNKNIKKKIDNTIA